ncbi:MAG: glycerol acyltransferase [Segetibacter sp.]|jgi:phage tail-like protein|nr:glycerol acyltransferase [Segetibacter sp.]
MATYIPPAGFHFKVEFVGVDGMGSDTEQRFQEVTGLSFEVETEDFKEGGENRFSYKLPKRIRYPNLVLKRGLLKGTALLNWFKSAISTYFTVVVYDFKPADIMITLLDESGEAAAIWNVVQAYPLKWSVSDFRSTDNSVVVETIELAYQYFERKM